MFRYWRLARKLACGRFGGPSAALTRSALCIFKCLFKRRFLGSAQIDPIFMKCVGVCVNAAYAAQIRRRVPAVETGGCPD